LNAKVYVKALYYDHAALDAAAVIQP